MTNDKLNIRLRPTEVRDLDILFQFQLDQEARYLAAFTSEETTNREAYLTKYTKLLNDPTVNNQTIVAGDDIVGSIAKFVIEGDTEITYWVDRNFWGQGIATVALTDFLALETIRPIFGRVAYDNISSQKVLENCGFVKVGTDQGFANERQTRIEEFIYRLDN